MENKLMVTKRERGWKEDKLEVSINIYITLRIKSVTSEDLIIQHRELYSILS